MQAADAQQLDRLLGLDPVTGVLCSGGRFLQHGRLFAGANLGGTGLRVVGL